MKTFAMSLLVALILAGGCVTQHPVQDRQTRMRNVFALIEKKLQPQNHSSPDDDWLAIPGTRGGTYIPTLLQWGGYQDFCAVYGLYVVDVWSNRLIYGCFSGKVFILSPGPDGNWRTTDDNVPAATISEELSIFLERMEPDALEWENRCNDTMSNAASHGTALPRRP